MKKHVQFLTLLLAINLPQAIWSQCTTPISMSAPVATAATCIGNGTVTVPCVSPAVSSPEKYQYALYNAANTGIVKPFQDNNIITDVAAGSYTVRVRIACLSGVSSELTAPVTVPDAYVPVSIQSVDILHMAGTCNDGAFSVTASGSASPLQYALVTAIAAPDIPASYVTPKQSSNTFKNLAAGTYYVRVFDACNSYATQQIVIPGRPVPDLRNILTDFIICDSLRIKYTVGNHYQQSSVYGNNAKGWIMYPSGLVDSLNTNNSAVVLGDSDSIRLSGPKRHIPDIVGAGNFDGSKNFPDNIINWPISITVGYRDACGVLHDSVITLPKPNVPELVLEPWPASPLSTCDSVAYVVRYKINTGAPWYTYAYVNQLLTYSLDSGATWLTNARMSDVSTEFLLARNKAINIQAQQCSLADNATVTPPDPGSLDLLARQMQRTSCFGTSGIRMLYDNSNAVGPVLVEVLHAPSGQAIPAPFIITSSNGATPEPQLTNLLPGTYTLRLTETTGACPRVRTTNVNISALDSIIYTKTEDCSGNWYITTSSKYLLHQTATNPGNTLRVILKNSSGTIVAGPYMGVANNLSSPTTTVITIPVTVINNLPDGAYTIHAYYNKTESTNDATACATSVMPVNITESGMDISKTRFFSGCPGNEGFIVGVVDGGVGPYTYTVYQHAVAPGNVVATSSTTNIFSSLALGTTYYLQVADNCGKSVTGQFSNAETILELYASSPNHPCLGNPYMLWVDSMPGVTYQWYKNNLPIVGAERYKYEFANYQVTDNGTYKVVIQIPGCQVESKTLTLDNSKCGITLPVSWGKFTATSQGRDVQLRWTVLTEVNNNRFDIEHSNNGVNYHNIGTVSGQGTIAATQAYDFLHRDADAGKHYYRIKQTDTNGQFSHSVTRIVTIAATQQIRVYPNPTTGVINIQADEKIEKITLKDILGSTMKVNNSGPNNINISHLPAGSYILTIWTDSKTWTEKINKYP